MTDEMCWQAALKFREQKGLEEGLQEGHKAGLQEGHKAGLQEGEQIGRRKMAKALKGKGYPVADIAEISGMSVEEVMEL